jgi:hypothetical protein
VPLLRSFRFIPTNLVEWSRWIQSLEVQPDPGTVVPDSIAAGAVTYPKIQNVTTDRLLGRDTSPAGQVQEIVVTGGVEFTGSGGIQRSALTGAVTAAAGSTTTAFRDSAAVSVIGRAANSTGTPADIAAASNGLYLGRRADAVAFQQVKNTEVFTDQTAEELAAGVTPTNFYYAPLDPRRYGLSEAASGATNRAAMDAGVAVAAEYGGAELFVPPGLFAIDATVTVDVDRVHIVGAGANASIWVFDPSGADVLFHFTKGASSIVQCSVRGFGFASNNSNDKTAIQIDDGRACIIEEIGISQNAWQGSGSIGIHVKGRDRCTFRKLDILCARPIFLDECTNDTEIDTDHFHFQDCELGSTEASGSAIEADDGVVLSNLSFGGYQAWVLGAYGFRWNDTTSPIASHNLRFSNVRTEQASDDTGYSFYLASTARNLQQVQFENCYLDDDRGGIYCRKVNTISIDDSLFSGGTGVTNFDITFQSGTELWLRNTFVQADSTVTLTNGVQVFAVPLVNTTSPIQSTVLYVHDQGALVSRKSRREDGVLSFKYKGTVDDDGQLNLPVLLSGGADVAVFRIAAKTGSTLAYAHGAWMPGTAPDIYGTTGLVSNTSVDGDLCVVDNTNALSVINRLGDVADIVIDVTWSD